MASSKKTTSATPPRAPRRQTATGRSTDTSGLASTLDEFQGPRDEYTLDELSDELGITITPEKVQEAQEALGAANLDELVVETVQVAILERVPMEYTLPDGTKSVRYGFQKRIADLTLVPSVDLQMRALNLSRKWGQEKTPVAQRVLDMQELILVAWRMTEPDMTLERLRMGGLDVQRTGKLYQMLFSPPNRP